jgi:tetratricopeptide (TPR) repeat protein/predicted Ser/Thr protein kinase
VVVTEEIRAGVVLADRYRVRRRLGRGGMATVFLAEDCVLGRDVAIKRLHTSGSDVHARRFRREAQIGASLMHPNLVTVFDTLSAAEGLLIVMEYVRGEPLSDMIGSEGIATGRVIEIVRPLASALDFAHENGVVHRDVKPANILIGEGGSVKLVDLGTATASNVGQITTESEVVGTLAYIAPERLAGDSVGEPAADIYALAVVAFEALTGHPPYRANSPAELLSKVTQRRRADDLESWPDASPKLGQMLWEGMDPKPERRQHTAGAFVRDLEAAHADRALPPAAARFAPTEPMTPPAAQTADPSPQPVRRPFEFEPRRRRPRWVLGAVACAAVLVALGVGLALSTGGGGNGGGRAGGDTQAGGPSAQSKAAGGSASSGGGASAQAIPPPSSSPDPATGTQLNEQGYSLSQAGQYTQAIAVLRRAVASFPRGTTDINYAYALYNLGHALRMAGHPEEAIPVLERRLQIPDQTDTVQSELDAARAEAGR